MCNNRKIGGKPAAPAPNTNPATFPASEVNEREGLADNGVAIATKAPSALATVAAAPDAPDGEKVSFVLSEETAASLFDLLRKLAEANLNGGQYEPDYAEASECARVLAELEATWTAADDPGRAVAPGALWPPEAVKTVSELSESCKRLEGKLKKAEAEANALKAKLAGRAA